MILILCLLCYFTLLSGVFENAVSYYRTSAPELKEERAMLLEEWLNMESGFGELGDIELVRVKLPKKLKKRRQIEIDDGPAGYVKKLVITLLLCHMMCVLICSWLKPCSAYIFILRF